MTVATFAPRARREAFDAVEWIRKDNPVAARGLASALIRAADRIGANPEIGVVRPDLAREPYRFLTLAGFRHIVVYNSERYPPLIVRVVHGSRDLPEVLRDL